MNIYNKIILMPAVFSVAVSFLSSCGDDKEVDEWSATYVYLQREDYLVENVKTFNLTHDAEGVGGDEISMTFAAKTQKPVSKDMTVSLEVKSSTKGFDSENVTLTSSQVTIKAGQQMSEEVIAKVDRTIFASTEDKVSYSFNISIKEISMNNGNTTISSNLRTLSAVVNKSAFCNLKSGTPAGSKLWNAISEWSFTIQDGVENQGSNSVIGNGGSDIATNGVPFWLTVDLKALKTIKGIQTKHWGAGYAPSQIEVFSSDNGSVWKSMGILDVKGGTQYVTFISPVATRYLKYQMLKVPSRVDLISFYVFIPNE